MPGSFILLAEQMVQDLNLSLFLLGVIGIEEQIQKEDYGQMEINVRNMMYI